MSLRAKLIVVGAALVHLLVHRIAWAEPAVPRGPVVVGDVGKRVGEFLSRFSEWGYAGAVLVAKDGEVVLAQGYGLADRASKRPNSPTTVFTVGSITKQFTGAAILLLVQAGKISVSDPITKYFNDVPEDKRAITVHQLLTHSAGFAGAIGSDFDTSLSRDAFLREALAAPLEFKPGERYEYSNVGYSILGILIEKITGVGYEQYLHDHLFSPAGMTRTGYLLPKYRDDELAIAYDDGRPWGSVIRKEMLPDGPSWHLRANGGIHSTVIDMYRWHLALQGERILSAESKAKLFAPHIAENPEESSHYGYGWAIFRTPNGKLIAHNGGNRFFSADFRHYVDKNLMFFVTCSAAGYDIDSISEKIARAALRGNVTLPPKTMTLSAADAEPLVGKYQLKDGSTLTVAAGDGALQLTPEGQSAFAAVFPGPPLSDTDAAGIGGRVRSMIEHSLRGDHSLLQQALSGRMPPEQVAAMAEGRWRELQAQHGAFKELHQLGVRAERDGMTVTFLRYEFESGTNFAAYVMRGNSFAGSRRVDGPPIVTFRQTAPGQFLAVDFDTGDTRQIALSSGEVRIDQEGKQIAARRVP